LGQGGLLDLQATGTRNRYQRLKTPGDPSALAEQLHERMIDRQRNELERLDQVLQFAAYSGCQVEALCGHFGETRSEPCGHCTRCLTQSSPVELSPSHAPPIDQTIIDEALGLRAEHPQLLSDPVVVARWLCGMTSPAISKAKLTAHPLFGALQQQDFREVQSQCEKELARVVVD